MSINPEQIEKLNSIGFEVKNGKVSKKITSNCVLQKDVDRAEWSVDVHKTSGEIDTRKASSVKGEEVAAIIQTESKAADIILNHKAKTTFTEPKAKENDPVDNLRESGFTIESGESADLILTDSASFENEKLPAISVVKRLPGRTIKGLTIRLGECGKIKIGKKGKTAKKGFRLPTKLDHFVVTTMDKEDDDFVPDGIIMGKIGDNCKRLKVRLPYDDPTLNFPTSFAYYNSASCKCRGDGELAVTFEGEVVNCDPTTCQHVKDKKCKPNGILSVMLDDAPNVGGVYKFRTTGWNSISNIYSSMEFLRGLTNGFLAFLPLSLVLTPKNTTIPGTGTPTTIYMVNLEYRGSLKDLATAVKQTMTARTLTKYSVKEFEKMAAESMELPEAPEDCKLIVDEFYPETAIEEMA